MRHLSFCSVMSLSSKTIDSTSQTLLYPLFDFIFNPLWLESKAPYLSSLPRRNAICIWNNIQWQLTKGTVIVTSDLWLRIVTDNWQKWHQLCRWQWTNVTDDNINSSQKWQLKRVTVDKRESGERWHWQLTKVTVDKGDSWQR